MQELEEMVAQSIPEEYGDDYILRKSMVIQASSWLRNLKNPEMDIGRSAEEFMRDLRALIPKDKGENRWFHSNEDIARLAVETAEWNRNHPGLPGYATGFPTFDEMFGGWERKQIYMWLARPAVGKTTVLLQLAWQLVQNKVPTIFFSPEASIEDLSARLICALAEVPVKIFRRGYLDEDQMEMIRRQSKRISASSLAIYDMSEINVDHMDRQFSVYEKKYGTFPKVVIVDYLQQMEGSDSFEKITENMKSLETFAKIKDVAIIMASQVSRSSSSGGDQAAGKGSGKIEELSTCVFNFEPIYDDKGKISRDEADKNRRMVRCVKNRKEGATFEIYLEFDPITSWFTEETWTS